MNEAMTLIVGTSALLVMIIFVILSAFLYQRRLLKKQREFAEIETMLKKQELRTTYAVIRGQDEERKRIAADIHDNVGGMLATLKIYSDLVIARDQDDELQRLNRKINNLVEDLSVNIRKVSHSLDSGTLTNFGLSAALEQLCETIRASGKIGLRCIIDLPTSPGPDASLHLYRIVQELFTNTLKHAGATHVRFEISEIKGDISIIYEDDGVGFDVTAVGGTSMGLRNIQSRTEKLGGEISIQSSNTGTTFIIEISAVHEAD